MEASNPAMVFSDMCITWSSTAQACVLLILLEARFLDRYDQVLKSMRQSLPYRSNDNSLSQDVTFIVPNKLVLNLFRSLKSIKQWEQLYFWQPLKVKPVALFHAKISSQATVRNSAYIFQYSYLQRWERIIHFGRVLRRWLKK